MTMAARAMAAGMIQRVEDAAAVGASWGRLMAGQPVRAAPLGSFRFHSQEFHLKVIISHAISYD